MPAVFLLGLLAAALGSLLFYARDFLVFWMAPDGAIVQNAIPGIATAIVEIGTIVVLTTYLIDRRWLPTRQAIMKILGDDAKSCGNLVLMFADMPTELTPDSEQQLLYTWRQFERYIRENNAQERIHLLSASLTPELANTVSIYFQERRAAAREVTALSQSEMVSEELLAQHIVAFHGFLVGRQRVLRSQGERVCSFVAARCAMQLCDFLLVLDPEGKAMPEQLTAMLHETLARTVPFIREFERANGLSGAVIVG